MFIDIRDKKSCSADICINLCTNKLLSAYISLLRVVLHQHAITFLNGDAMKVETDVTVCLSLVVLFYIVAVMLEIGPVQRPQFAFFEFSTLPSNR